MLANFLSHKKFCRLPLNIKIKLIILLNITLANGASNQWKSFLWNVWDCQTAKNVCLKIFFVVHCKCGNKCLKYMVKYVYWKCFCGPQTSALHTDLSLDLGSLVAIHVHSQLPLLRHQVSEVHRKSVRVIESPCHVACRWSDGRECEWVGDEMGIDIVAGNSPPQSLLLPSTVDLHSLH